MTDKSKQKNGGWSIGFAPVLKTAADMDEADKKCAQEAESYKEWLLEMAEKLKNDEPLTSIQKDFIATELRIRATQIKAVKVNRRGKPDQLPNDINHYYAEFVKLAESEGLTKDRAKIKAINEIAKQFSVTSQAVRKKLKKLGGDSYLEWCGNFLDSEK